MRHYLAFQDISRFYEDRNIYSAAAIKLATNIRNHLVVNLPKVIKKAVYQCSPRVIGETHDARKMANIQMLFEINGWNRRNPIEISADRHNFVNECRRILSLHNGAAIGHEWLDSKDNLSQMLRFFVFTNRLLENVYGPNGRREDGWKLFAILPICTIKSHFITLDTFGIHGVAREAGVMYEDFQIFDFRALRGSSKTKK